MQTHTHGSCNYPDNMSSQAPNNNNNLRNLKDISLAFFARQEAADSGADSGSTTGQKRKRSIADVALAQSVKATGSDAYQRAVDPAHKSVGANIPKTRLYVDALSMLEKNPQSTFTLDELLRKLDVDPQTPHRVDLSAHLRQQSRVSFVEGRFQHKAELSWVKSSDDLMKLFRDTPTQHYAEAKLAALYPSAMTDLENFSKARKILKIVNVERKLSSNVYALNRYDDLEPTGVTEDMKTIWSNIAIPEDPAAFAVALRKKSIEPTKQVQKIKQDVGKNGVAKKVRKARAGAIQNLHVVGFDFNKIFEPSAK